MADIVKKENEGLTTRERAAYKLSLDRREPFLSATLAEQLYRLYESGKTCEEIFVLNPALSLGIVVRARMDFGWDDKRQAYLEGMLLKARVQAQQLSLESLGFLGDLLTAFHHHDREKLQRFIQTKNPEDLAGAMMVSGPNLKVYRDILEMLMKLTGQDNNSTQKIVVEHHTPTQEQRPLTPEEASNLLLEPKK